MKLFLIFFILTLEIAAQLKPFTFSSYMVSSPPTVNPDYFVKTGGNDGLSGTTEANAWATIGKVNSATLTDQNSDGKIVVAFNGGNQFSSDSLICKTGVTYTSYGVGKAIIGDSLTTTKTTISIRSVNHVTLENLKIFGTSTDADWYTRAIDIYKSSIDTSAAQDSIVIKNCLISGGLKSTEGRAYGFYAAKINGLYIENCEIRYFGYIGYLYYPYHTYINSNELHHIYVGDPPNGIYVGDLYGGGKIQCYGAIATGDTVAAWECHYTLVFSNNNCHDIETGPFGTVTMSHFIIENNIVHDNLDERDYHQGIDHPSYLGKLDDWEPGAYVIKFPGSIGGIIRNNTLYNLGRHNYTTNIYNPNPGFSWAYSEGDGTYHLGTTYPDGQSTVGQIIQGSGMQLQCYGNVVYNCSAPFIGRSTATGVDLTQLSLSNDIYNNTFYNVGYDTYEWPGCFITFTYRTTTPFKVRNNIFYQASSSGTAVLAVQGDIWEGNNIFINAGVDSATCANWWTPGTGTINPPVAIQFCQNAGSEWFRPGTASTFGADTSQIKFMSIANHDFRLRPGSIAIDAGFNNMGANGDGLDNQGLEIKPRGYISGTKDIGAFEYGYVP